MSSLFPSTSFETVLILDEMTNDVPHGQRRVKREGPHSSTNINTKFYLPSLPSSFQDMDGLSRDWCKVYDYSPTSSTFPPNSNPAFGLPPVGYKRHEIDYPIQRQRKAGGSYRPVSTCAR